MNDYNQTPTKPELRQSAVKIKNASILMRILLISFIVLVLILAVTYLISYFYDKYSSFSVVVDKYDMVNQGLSLSETGEFEVPVSRLESHDNPECTNISGSSIPDDVNMINGEHNGASYIAYTFYLKNTGEEQLSVKYSLNLSNVTLNVDAAVRLKLFINDDYEVFAKTKSDGTGPESGTTEFLSQAIVTEDIIENIDPEGVYKFTVVMWLEGNDPDCVDSIIGGRLKAGMNFSIVETS